MDMFSYSQASLARLEQLAGWLLGDVFTLANLAQIPAVALTGAIAWLLSRPLRRWIVRMGTPAGSAGSGAQASWRRDWTVRRLAPLAMPALWGVGLWVALEIANRMAWPHDIARIAANLLVAWLVIRLVADLVPSRPFARMIALTAWSLAALNILHLLGPLIDVLDSIAITLGNLRVSALTVIKGFLSLAVLLWVAMFASRVFDRRITHVADLTPRAQVLFGKLLKITLVTLAFVLALTSVGIDLSSFALLTGAVGVGVGLGLQKTVSNLFSGIVLLLDRSIKPGDVIEVGGTYGWVSALGARYVAVETRDGMEYLIPNEDIITHQVLNWSHKSERVRLKVNVRAPLDADVETVLALLKEAATRPARILKQPAPNAFIMAFGESAIELQLRFWIADAHQGIHNVKGETLLEVWKLFREHGIPLPHPKRDVYVQPARAGETMLSGAEPEPIGPPRQIVGARLGAGAGR